VDAKVADGAVADVVEETVEAAGIVVSASGWAKVVEASRLAGECRCRKSSGIPLVISNGVQ